jgi:hypothetical protein
MRGVVVVSILLVTAVACSGSNDGGEDPEQPPTLDRIDGPAVVDPSFDPFATDPSAAPTTLGG